MIQQRARRKRNSKLYNEKNINGSRTGEEADGIVMKEEGKRRRSRMGTRTGREGASREGRMREVERRSNFLTRRLVAA